MSAERLPRTFLIIDDDKVLCDAIKDYFSSKTIEMLTSNTGTEGLAICSQRKVDVVLLDQRLPDVEGHTLCPPILRQNDRTKIIFITAYPSFDGAVKAIKLGAFDYLSKPFELEELDLAIKKAFRTIDLERVEQFQKYRSEKESEEAVIIGGDGGLSEVVRLVDVAASSDAPVLITGETGTGKDLMARAIHHRSPLRREVFVEINCAALPESLIEAELFGHEKGAFTGAVTSNKGIFEMAEGGTLLLNEIGEMPLNLQSKLLSVLEGKKIKKLGGELITPVDFRILAATSVDLEKAAGKSFRQDLYYRLGVIRIHIPPLRDRRGDIPELCGYLLKKIARGGEVKLPDSETARLMEYRWPGNVRELRNVLERAYLIQKEPSLQPSEILMKENGISKSTPPLLPAGDELTTLEEVEKNYIKHALDKLSHNYTQTARSLGISLSTLKRKVKEYNLE
ncbi:MAG TPA: sigma-54 dependent transcriptional regulator [Thermodesulfobacteriota bacterium]|nr:sigma-54 dependent transcriptional regulator [Thermodesulfobacteriota bacterium]